MSAVLHLVTIVDIDDASVIGGAAMVDGSALEGAEPGLAPAGLVSGSDNLRFSSMSALHLAVLQDGRRLVLLDDRGWGSSGAPDIWSRTTVEVIECEARTVVGPDEPDEEHERAAMERAHWHNLADILRRQGVQVSADELSRAPHEVELTERLRTRLADG